MKPIPLSAFADIVGGMLYADDAAITGFATDSRDVKPGDLFLAIVGENVDGHAFVPQALRNGAAAALVERPVEGRHVLVSNLVEALARYGRHFRSQFTGPVIGVTGSAGKTTTKEFLASALSPLGSVLKTEGNRNTEYTSPLMWADLTGDTKAIVVEMAMRGFGQIAHLASIAQPTIGLVTNVGFSHMLQVGSREGVARAKGELLEALPQAGTAVLWQEDDYLGKLREIAGGRPIRTFGFSPEADCRVVTYRASNWRSSIVVGELDGVQWTAAVPAAGRHLALSAAAAVLAASVAGVPAVEAAHPLGDARLPPLRMEVRELNGATILLDTYNASPPSMIGAIETLADLTPKGHRKAVIGEMKELGDQTDDAHRSVGEALVESEIDEVLFVGEPMKEALHVCLRKPDTKAAYRMAESLDDVRAFLKSVRAEDAVLIKGSRALELEKALEGLS